MPHLSLSLFGGFEARLDGESLTAFGADKARALLAYLVMEAARPHRRAELGGLLWPDLPEKKAAHNLSQNLLRLRTALHESKSPVQPFLLLTNQDIQFNPLTDYRLDVVQFTQLIQAHGQHHHSNTETCPVCMQWLHQAADLYRGDLLAGFFVRDSFGFEEWRLARQEVLHRQALEVLTRLTAYHEQRGEYDRVQDCARRLIKLEPWSDQPHLQLMRALNHTGQTAAALEQYETYRQILAEELGLEPSAAVAALYEEIKRADSGQALAKDTSQPDGDSPHSLRSLSSPGERRQVTVLMCGRATTHASRDPEDLHEQMSSCRAQCESIVNQFGGYRLPRQGDKCLILFGYPQALEDAPRRAVDAGLAMTTALSISGEVSIGIHTGPMVEGERRGSREDPEIFSEAPNLARACQGLAEAGSVVITEDTERLVHGLFNCESLEPRHLMETSRTMAVYRARSNSGMVSRLDWLAQTRRLTTFVGREPELKQLLDTWQRVQHGQGQVVLISGESGLGKSRLMLEFRSALLHADNHQPSAVLWLESRCSTYYQNTGLYPIIGLLEQLLDYRPGDGPNVKRDKLLNTLARCDLARPAAVWLLSLLLGLPTDTPLPESITAEQRARMREVFVALVQKRASEQPLLLVIEDLHWADPSTIGWLGQSLDSLAAGRCLILLTSRPSFTPAWPPRDHLLPIKLNPLSAAQTEQMVADLTSRHTLRNQLRQHIINQTDGIPLFIEELTRTILESDSQPGEVSETARGLPKIPATLHDSLMARLDHVGAAKETAQWAAALGREFTYSVLRAVVPFDKERLQNDLVRLMEADLIQRPEQSSAFYSFKHGLIQETAYASLLKRTRQDYHRRIAETLETRFPKMVETQPEILAQHYAHANLKSQAVDYWLRAGEQATAHGATLEARTFFDHASELVDPSDPERRWRALLGRETVLHMHGDVEPQQQDLTALLDLAEAFDDDTRRAQAYTRQTRYASSLADYPAQLQAARAAIAAARRSGALGVEVEALTFQVTALMRLGEWAAVQQAVQETQPKARQITDENIQAYALAAIALYYVETGDLARAVELLNQSLEAIQRAKSRRFDLECQFHGHLGLAYAQLGLYAQARATLEAGVTLADTIGIQRYQAYHKLTLGWAYWHDGDTNTALSMEGQAFEGFLATGEAYGQAACQAYLGYILENAGNPTLATEHLAQARTGFAKLGVDPDRFEAQAVEARATLAQGRKEEAWQLANEVWTYLHEHGSQGLGSPSLAYVCVADVFEATEGDDPASAAYAVIEAGYHDLMQRAEKISGADWRRSFLENESENRAMVERWRQHTG